MADNKQSSIPPSSEAASEALKLSAEILRNVEMNEIPLPEIALKTIRLARLLNDLDFEKTMRLELSGYPTENGVVPLGPWRLGVAAGRGYQDKDGSERIFLESIDAILIQVKADQATLDNAITAASTVRAHPTQPSWKSGFALDDKTVEMWKAQASRDSLLKNTDKLASRRSLIYDYALSQHFELKFSSIASDVFARVRERADQKLAAVVPDAVMRFTAVHDNLRSQSSEDWSNAVHSCRRILEDLADAVFPASDEERIVEANGKKLQVKLGKAHYINRIMAFIQDHTSSRTFEHIVGSHLSFMGERLDAVFQAAQKGSHATILSREEADRFVVYTYLLVGDILSLL